MEEYGIKVSVDNVDALTAGVGDLLLDTSKPIIKIKASGTGTLTITDGGGDSDTIYHNLGYVPLVLVYGQVYSISSGANTPHYLRLPLQEFQSSGTIYSDFGYTIDSEKLVIEGGFSDGTSNSDSFDYFYYIFYEE